MGNATPNVGEPRDLAVAWLATVYDACSARAYAQAMYVLGDQAAAQEALVAAFTHLFRQRHECTEADVPATLLALTRHFAIAALRRRLGLPVSAPCPPSLAALDLHGPPPVTVAALAPRRAPMVSTPPVA